MALILNIDTALSEASIAICDHGNMLASSANKEQRDHASWIHQAIKQLLQEVGLEPRNLDAVAVTIGPGSYTGLRVGLATAKGLCYSLNIPLITENTLRLMAFHAIQHYSATGDDSIGLFVPMIDARRMEVFTAVYNSALDELLPPQPLVLDAGSLMEFRNDGTLFFGSGAEKFRNHAADSGARFEDLNASAQALGRLSYDKYVRKQFSDIAYSEPLYLKEFYSPEKK